MLLLASAVVLPLGAAEKPKDPPRKAFLGFDRNEYPGDEAMQGLRRDFSFTGYWLNTPPGATRTTWTGKRGLVQSLGYGFLVLFQGKLSSELQASSDPARLGTEDALAAIQAAKDEGFPKGTIIFLGHEEGGRLVPIQRVYLHAWLDQMKRSPYRAGVYCSGIPVREPSGESITTADDIKRNAGKRRVYFWVSNDACPPSPGCFTALRPLPQESGIPFALVWQFAQSPKRAQISASCSGAYRTDGNCYPPESDVFVDINSSASSDPSRGRTKSRPAQPGR
jgi:hypothetical protein